MFVVHLNLPTPEMGFDDDEIDYKKIHSTVLTTNAGDVVCITDERAPRRQRVVIGRFRK
ncbi:hypothetical protein JQ628_27310 [Bradyrhizobium lablabi]|nr:hypothetical protein [Bradyrhizobium lablabi]